jgi:2-dehydro-3-deoxyphosphogalactonate aldolase
MELREWFGICPLIAILRGITPPEVDATLRQLWDAGIRIAEIPWNSPEPIEGIRRAVDGFGNSMLIGAGTVMSPSQVQQIHSVGARLIVTPHAQSEIVREAKQLGMFVLPGVGTTTEAFSMLEAGADGVKIFPADIVGPRIIPALRAVLPRGTLIVPVGGVDEHSITSWQAAGADGYGVGRSLYKPGSAALEVGAAARHFVQLLNRSTPQERFVPQVPGGPPGVEQ